MSKEKETNKIEGETKTSKNRGHLSWALKGEEKVSTGEKKNEKCNSGVRHFQKRPMGFYFAKNVFLLSSQPGTNSDPWDHTEPDIGCGTRAFLDIPSA